MSSYNAIEDGVHHSRLTQAMLYTLSAVPECLIFLSILHSESDLAASHGFIKDVSMPSHSGISCNGSGITTGA